MADIKYCEKHPRNYALPSGLCCHRNCMESIIQFHANKRRGIKRLWKLIKKKDLVEEFISYLFYELLKDQEKGKPAFINSVWLLFRIRRYWFKNIKYDCTFDQVPQQARETAIDRGMVNVVDDMIVAESLRHKIEGDAPFAFKSPERAVWLLELNDWIAEHHGEDFALYFAGHIDRIDLRKMRQWKVEETLLNIRKAKSNIAEFIKKEHAGGKHADE